MRPFTQEELAQFADQFRRMVWTAKDCLTPADYIRKLFPSYGEKPDAERHGTLVKGALAPTLYTAPNVGAIICCVPNWPHWAKVGELYRKQNLMVSWTAQWFVTLFDGFKCVLHVTIEDLPTVKVMFNPEEHADTLIWMRDRNMFAFSCSPPFTVGITIENIPVEPLYIIEPWKIIWQVLAEKVRTN